MFYQIIASEGEGAENQGSRTFSEGTQFFLKNFFHFSFTNISREI